MTVTVFFQLARGRAMVRNRSMRKARSLQRRLAIGHELGFPLTEREVVTLRAEMAAAVARARRAHQSWRHYRKVHLSLVED